jgi:hypothetical protein
MKKLEPSLSGLGLAAAALCCVTAVAAQTAAPAAPELSQRPRPPEFPAEIIEPLRRLAQLSEETASWASGEMSSERVVKAAPYCADAVHETVQSLADGNRIVHTQTTKLCRDGEGRTRQEVTGRDGRKRVYLRDPVARENWALDPARKTARRSIRGLAGDARAPVADATQWREFAERSREWARQLAERARGGVWRDGAAPATQPASPAPAAPPAPPAPALILRSDNSERRTERVTEVEGGRRQVEVEVIRLGGGADALAAMPDMPMPPMPPMPGMAPTFNFRFDAPAAVGQRAQLFAPRGPAVVTALPAREIEGLKVNGERSTWTIEAGRIGNEKPIVVSREVWTSPELMLTVMTRDNDPRSGEVSYRLQNVKRGEPDATLMKVPADYIVRQGFDWTAPLPPAPPASPAAPAPKAPLRG